MPCQKKLYEFITRKYISWPRKPRKYHINLKEGCTPIVHSAQRIPHSLKKQLKQTLDSNVRSGMLCKVDQSTDWVNNLVVVEKRNGSIRLCLDPKDLNKVIKRGSIIKYRQFKKSRVNWQARKYSPHLI